MKNEYFEGLINEFAQCEEVEVISWQDQRR